VDIPNGGSLLLRGNLLRKGPSSGNPRAAIMIGAEGLRHRGGSLRIEANRFESLLPQGTVFVRNRSSVPVTMAGNVLTGPRIAPLVGPGQAR
jgi:hypothetical protein